MFPLIGQKTKKSNRHILGYQMSHGICWYIVVQCNDFLHPVIKKDSISVMIAVGHFIAAPIQERPSVFMMRASSIAKEVVYFLSFVCNPSEKCFP